MSHKFVRRGFLKSIATGSGALALAGSASQAAADDKFLTSAKLGNFNLFYEEHGEGPAVIFAHGAGGNHMSWFQQVPAFSKKFKCITVDQRTFGFSRDVPGGPAQKGFVGDFTGLLDSLGIRKLALVGQSMGGSTVLGFAAAHPERVTALVMSDTNGGYSNPEIVDIRRKLGTPPTPPGMTARDFMLARATAPDFPTREPVKWFLYREISAMTLPPETAPTPAPATSAPAPAPDISRILSEKVPVLFVVGAEDKLISPLIIEAMHRAMPGSELVKVSGAGHSVYYEKPDDYNKIVMDFLSKHAVS